MDELAVTVSDILNQAAGGVGDISQWLATNGLSGYAAVNIAQNAAICILAAIFFVASVFGIYVSLKHWDGGEEYAVAFLVSGVVFAGSLTVLCSTIPTLVGWLASPDGMLLQTLVDGLMK